MVFVNTPLPWCVRRNVSCNGVCFIFNTLRQKFSSERYTCEIIDLLSSVFTLKKNNNDKFKGFLKKIKKEKLKIQAPHVDVHVWIYPFDVR